MSLTFDEVINRLETDTIGNYEMQEMLENLRDIYAPAIEMTSFERTNAVGLLDFKRDELTFVVGEHSDGTPVLDILPKRYFSAWLHPETVKVVE